MQPENLGRLSAGQRIPFIPITPRVRNDCPEIARRRTWVYHRAMTKPIVQTAKFPVSAKQLYDVYLDPKRHAGVTGAPVRISPTPGSKFEAFDGMLSGSTVFTLPGKLIVQRWRSENFRITDLDSILILTFSDEDKQGRIDLVHVNVPAQDYKGVTEGWEKYYWAPLRRYLKKEGV
ncbi:MAG: SRPBCC domain-containing protein [Tepidisphaeraceae bacterium]|jgi:activator of HSP90 ATPase